MILPVYESDYVNVNYGIGIGLAHSLKDAKALAERFVKGKVTVKIGRAPLGSPYLKAYIFTRK